MSIALGATATTTRKIGATPITKRYLGSTLVWSANPIPALSPALCLDASALALADNDPVSSWTDLSGNARHATASTTARPTFKTGILNGKPVIRFNGTSHVMTGSLAALGTGNYTVLLVAKSSSVTGYHTPLNVGGSAANSALLLATDGATNDGTWEVGRVGANYIATTAPVTTNVWHVLAVDRSGATTSRAWVNGASTTPASGNPGAQNITSGYVVGDYAGGGQKWLGDIAEIIVFAAALSTADRQAVEAHLTAKWLNP